MGFFIPPEVITEIEQFLKDSPQAPLWLIAKKYGLKTKDIIGIKEQRRKKKFGRDRKKHY